MLLKVIWDGEVGYIESSFMMILYLVYIVIMKFNVELRELLVSRVDVARFGLQVEMEEQGNDTAGEEEDMVMQLNQQQQNYQSTGPAAAADPSLDPWSDTWSAAPAAGAWTSTDSWGRQQSLDVFPSAAASSPRTGYIPPSLDPKKTSLFEAANKQILKHRRLFRPRTRFMAAANLIIIQNRKSKTSTKQKSRRKAGPSRGQQKRAMTQMRQETIRKPSIAADPEEVLRTVSSKSRFRVGIDSRVGVANRSLIQWSWDGCLSSSGAPTTHWMRLSSTRSLTAGRDRHFSCSRFSCQFSGLPFSPTSWFGWSQSSVSSILLRPSIRKYS